MKNIVLIGFMGSGKTFVSAVLGRKLKRPVISTDQLIEQKEGMSVADIFKKHGEAYFREKEEEVVQRIAGGQGAIIDGGGGVVINLKNIAALKKNGVLFYLWASPEFLYKTIALNKDRPLMQVKDPMEQIKKMLKEREKFYNQADYKIVSEHKKIEEIADDIIKLIDK